MIFNPINLAKSTPFISDNKTSSLRKFIPFAPSQSNYVSLGHESKQYRKISQCLIDVDYNVTSKLILGTTLHVQNVSTPSVSDVSLILDATPHVHDVSTPSRSEISLKLDTTPHVHDVSTPSGSKVSLILDTTPHVHDVSTPSGSDEGDLSVVDIYSRDNESALHDRFLEAGDIVTNPLDTDDVRQVLKNLRIKNVNRVIIATLNINSISTKFEFLKELIGDYLDILIIQETKLDSTFSTE